MFALKLCVKTSSGYTNQHPGPDPHSFSNPLFQIRILICMQLMRIRNPGKKCNLQVNLDLKGSPKTKAISSPCMTPAQVGHGEFTVRCRKWYWYTLHINNY